MRTLDVLRHAMRRKPGKHLSQDGIDLARLVGATAGPYDRVVTSTLPRAIETAIAMGFEVTDTLAELAELPDAVLAEFGWPMPFSAIAATIAKDGRGAKFARKQAALWGGIVAQVADGQRALIVSHGLIIELGIIGCLPDADGAAWGGPIGFCEGITLSYDGTFTHGEILLVPAQYQATSS